MKKKQREDDAMYASLSESIDKATGKKAVNEKNRRQLLKNSVAAAAVYVTKDKDGVCHVTCFDAQVRQQGTIRLRDFDCLYILLQTSAYHNFEQFFKKFYAHTTCEKTLVSMQEEMRNVSPSVKAELHDAKKRVRELDKLMERVRKTSMNINPHRVGDPVGELKTVKNVLSSIYEDYEALCVK